MVSVRVERLLDGPIITEATHQSIGANIQGPSLIRVPDWVEERLGRYYLYFADHKGSYIRLAYADDLLGPWIVHPSGSLQIGHSKFPTEPPEATSEQLDAAITRIRSMGINLDGLGHDLAKEMTWPTGKKLLARLHPRRLHIRAGHAGAAIPFEGPPVRVRVGSNAFQPGHATRRTAEKG